MLASACSLKQAAPLTEQGRVGLHMQKVHARHTAITHAPPVNSLSVSSAWLTLTSASRFRAAGWTLSAAPRCSSAQLAASTAASARRTPALAAN